MGWWVYQKEELDKQIADGEELKRQMGLRLKGYVNVLVEEYIEVVERGDDVDKDALLFLWMLKNSTVS